MPTAKSPAPEQPNAAAEAPAPLTGRLLPVEQAELAAVQAYDLRFDERGHVAAKAAGLAFRVGCSLQLDDASEWRLVRPGLGFGRFYTARRTLAGYEAMAMVRKGRLRKISGRHIQAQATFVAELFQVAA